MQHKSPLRGPAPSGDLLHARFPAPAPAYVKGCAWKFMDVHLPYCCCPQPSCPHRQFDRYLANFGGRTPFPDSPFSLYFVFSGFYSPKARGLSAPSQRCSCIRSSAFLWGREDPRGFSYTSIRCKHYGDQWPGPLAQRQHGGRGEGKHTAQHTAGEGFAIALS